MIVQCAMAYENLTNKNVPLYYYGTIVITHTKILPSIYMYMHMYLIYFYLHQL